jgi:hypothetical protein
LKTPIWETERVLARSRFPKEGKKAAKSLVLKDFTLESFKLKDLPQIFRNSMIPKDRG